MFLKKLSPKARLESVMVKYSGVIRERAISQAKAKITLNAKAVSDFTEEQLEINAHYSGYLEKQNADIIAFRKDESLIIPYNIDYYRLSGLSNEVKSKFNLIKPKTLGQALRIDGITPAAVYILLSYVKKSAKRYINS